ncbi:MAG: hypothetical protein ACYC5O_12680 [Anaerolineae bacterium]
MIVATLPDVKFPLGRDILLAKSAALYGDEAVLLSPTFCGVEPLMGFSDRPVLHQLLWLSILKRDPGFVQGESLTPAQRQDRIRGAERMSLALMATAVRWVELTLSASGLTDRQMRERDVIAAEVTSMAQRIQEVFSDDSMLVQRARELQKAEELGLIRLAQIHDAPSLFYNQRKLISDVTEALSAPDAYGALDERLTDPLTRMRQGQAHKQKMTRIADQMFRRLPLFEEATFDEIRDIRQELAPYLANFRRGLSEVSQQVRTQPWDEDFPHEVECELTTRLLPEVAALEETVEANSYLRRLLRKAAREPLVLPASSALGMLVSSATDVSAVAAQVAGAVAGCGLLAYEAYEQWKEDKRKAQGNVFFLYYRVGKLLAQRR